MQLTACSLQDKNRRQDVAATEKIMRSMTHPLHAVRCQLHKVTEFFQNSVTEAVEGCQQYREYKKQSRWIG